MKASIGLFVRILGCLFLLLILTTALAFLPLQPWTWILSILFAFIMTAFILLFFMKLRSSEPLIWLTSAAGFTWLALLVGLVLLDYLSRPWPK